MERSSRRFLSFTRERLLNKRALFYPNEFPLTRAFAYWDVGTHGWKVAPGDYLQVSVVANVILPPGDFAPSADLTSSVTGSGARAMTLLLAGGLQ